MRWTVLAISIVSSALPVAGSWEAGVEAARAGDYERAVEVLSQVIRDHPDYAPGRYLLGVALSKVGRHPEALDSLQQAVEMAPGEPR
jgi:Flp pilus assembly protein TadD